MNKRIFLLVILFLLITGSVGLFEGRPVLAYEDEAITRYMLAPEGELDRTDKLILFIASPAFGKWISILFLTLLAITFYLFLVIIAALFATGV